MKRVKSSADALDEFWLRVKEDSLHGSCWTWLGSKDANGYGIFAFGGVKVRAHRFAYEIANAERIPDEMYACHRCDNPSCVRPDHVFPGTPKDNVDDMWRKGRANRPPAIPRCNIYHSQPIDDMWRIQRAAERLGLSVSEFASEAVRQRANRILGHYEVETAPTQLTA